MNNNTCYIYINGKSYDGTVFVTQIADWLKVYAENGVEFKYFHVFAVQNCIKKAWLNQQAVAIKNVIPTWVEKSWSFPSRGFLVRLNVMLWAGIIKKMAKGADRIVIFSRMIYGKEMELLRKKIHKPIYFIYDARAASVEENRHNAVKGNYLSKAQFDMFSHISFTEYMTVKEADRIFSVSNKLKQYLIQNYGCPADKFFIYPCLSDNRKFYYDDDLRASVRKELGYNDSDKVILYAGGLKNVYHVLEQTLVFLNAAAKALNNVKVLLLSKDEVDNKEIQEKYPALKGRYINRSVPNEEMVRYLNAADFGLLFRENVPMNNVASPSKFAEYMLCGLPTIISEGVGDYSELCTKEGLGLLLSENDLSNMENVDILGLLSKPFDRGKIAAFGKAHFSKQSRIPDIIKEFTYNS